MHFLKSTLFQLLLLCAVTSQAFEGKYHRALVFQGGGFQTGMFLGMLAGARSVSASPDVIVSTCGGSLAAAIINVFPDSTDQKALIESPEFYRMLNSIEFTREKHLGRALELILQMRLNTWHKKIPPLFTHYLMDIPQTLPLPELEKSFAAEKPASRKPAIVIIAAEMRFTPGDSGKDFSPSSYFYETYFTDKMTAKLLRGFQSPIPLEFPNSYVNLKTKTITTATVLEAARASISDMYYMPPVQIGNHFYITGAVDLYPLEVAHAVADETLMDFPPGFGTPVEYWAFESVFGYSDEARLESLDDKVPSDYWMETWKDESKTFEEAGMNPRFKLSSMGLIKGVPSTYEVYLDHVRRLWQYGYEKARDAILEKKRQK